MSLVDHVRSSITAALGRLVREGALGATDEGALAAMGSWTVERPKRLEHGHYATNVAMVLTKRVGVAPRTIAER